MKESAQTGTHKELGALRLGVINAMREKMLNDVLDKSERVDDSTELSLDHFQNAIKAIRETPEKEVLELYLRQHGEQPVAIDWERLQKEFVPTHSPTDCQVEWEHHIVPALVGRPPWTAEEDKHLIALVTKHHERNWPAIAAELAVCHTLHLCSRFQQCIKPTVFNRLADKRTSAARGTRGASTTSCSRSLLSSCCSQHSKNATRTTSTSKLINRQWKNTDDTKLRAAVQLYGEQNWQMSLSPPSQITTGKRAHTSTVCKMDHNSIGKARWVHGAAVHAPLDEGAAADHHARQVAGGGGQAACDGHCVLWQPRVDRGRALCAHQDRRPVPRALGQRACA